MPLTCSQIITLALQDSRKNVPFATGGGFSSQAGQLFQMILDDLCYKYDLKININPVSLLLTGNPTPPQFIGITPGTGPYPLPADYLRMAQDEVTFNFGNAPFRMVNTDLSDIDLLGILVTTNNFPSVFATDFSTTPPSLYVWPPPISPISLNLRYFRIQPPIPSPQSANTVPWFNDGMYLKSRLTGELLKPSSMAKGFLDEAQGLLDQYLKLEDDSEGRAIIMKKDERQFPSGRSSKLPRTKGQDF
jgi:hypothetical protein